MSEHAESGVVLAELHEVIADVIDVDQDAIEYDTHFINDLGVDSLLSLEVLVTLERKYGVKLSEQDLQQMYSLRQIHELLNSRIRAEA